VSSLRVPPFDMLTAQPSPYSGFGEPLAESSDLEKQLLSLADEARTRLNEGFGRQLANDASLPAELDSIVREMWEHGWSPDTGNVNLFATDFGLVLAAMLRERYKVAMVFRSATDVSHVSLFWVREEIEVFPFHHVVKCLLDSQSDSIASFADGIERVLTQ
jgi:hypothetical protein